MTGASLSRGRRIQRTSPYRLFILLALLAGSAVAVVLRVFLDLHRLLAYLAGVSVATLLLYAYDKAAAARGGWTRVPERVLHAVCLAGGTPAALLAQVVLRHKTVKRSFRAWVFVTLVAQLLALAAWAYWRYGRGIGS